LTTQDPVTTSWSQSSPLLPPLPGGHQLLCHWSEEGKKNNKKAFPCNKKTALKKMLRSKKKCCRCNHRKQPNEICPIEVLVQRGPTRSENEPDRRRHLPIGGSHVQEPDGGLTRGPFGPPPGGHLLGHKLLAGRLQAAPKAGGRDRLEGWGNPPPPSCCFFFGTEWGGIVHDTSALLTPPFILPISMSSPGEVVLVWLPTSPPLCHYSLSRYRPPMVSVVLLADGAALRIGLVEEAAALQWRSNAQPALQVPLPTGPPRRGGGGWNAQQVFGGIK